MINFAWLTLIILFPESALKQLVCLSLLCLVCPQGGNNIIIINNNNNNNNNNTSITKIMHGQNFEYLYCKAILSYEISIFIHNILLMHLNLRQYSGRDNESFTLAKL